MNLSFVTIQHQLQKEKIRADFLTKIYDDNVRRCNLNMLRRRDDYVIQRYRELTSGTTTMERNERQRIKDDYNNQQSMYELIRAEIRNNIWYFLSEIVEVPQDCYYIGGHPFFEIYPSVADPERPNAFRMAKWMSFYFFAVTQNIPACIATFSECDKELAIALHIVYEIMVKEIIPPRVTEENLFSFDGKDHWNWLKYIVISNKANDSQFLFQERLKYLVQRIIQATMDAWPFLHVLDERRIDVFNRFNALMIKKKISDNMLNTIASSSSIFTDGPESTLLLNILSIRGKMLREAKQQLPTFLMFVSSANIHARVLYNAVNYSIFNTIYDDYGPQMINALTSSSTRPVIFTTNILDYIDLNDERMPFIKNNIDEFEVTDTGNISSVLFGQFVTKEKLGIK